MLLAASMTAHAGAWRAMMGGEFNSDPHGVADVGWRSEDWQAQLLTDTIDVRWRAEREHIWARLSHDLPREAIDACTSATVTLDELAAAGEDVLAGRHRGRVVVTVNS